MAGGPTEMSPASRRPLLLLVDDDDAGAHALARMLSDDGFEVEWVREGNAAIDRLSRAPLPEGLITDLYPPHADGLTIARLARSQRPMMLAIVLTGHPELAVCRGESFVPALVVLAKPLDYEILTRTLRGLLHVAA